MTPKAAPFYSLWGKRKRNVPKWLNCTLLVFGQNSDTSNTSWFPTNQNLESFAFDFSDLHLNTNFMQWGHRNWLIRPSLWSPLKQNKFYSMGSQKSIDLSIIMITFETELFFWTSSSSSSFSSSTSLRGVECFLGFNHFMLPEKWNIIYAKIVCGNYQFCRSFGLYSLQYLIIIFQSFKLYKRYDITFS